MADITIYFGYRTEPPYGDVSGQWLGADQALRIVFRNGETVAVEWMWGEDDD